MTAEATTSESRRTAFVAAAAAATVAGAAHAGPALTSVLPVRTTALPGIAGIGSADHVALTFDDGPDPVSTPQFLRLLEAYDVKATFFLLGFMLDRSPGLAREIADAGHDIALHGYQHINLLRRTPWATRDDLTRAHDLIADLTGAPPRFYRPPYGVLTGSAWRTASRLGMQTVLWTCWGKDWSAKATPDTVHRTVSRRLAGGGTILLHDADCTSAPESWRSTLGAVPRLIEDCHRDGLQVGPLSRHFSA